MLPDTTTDHVVDLFDRILDPATPLAEQVVLLGDIDPETLDGTELAAMAALLRSRCHRVTGLPHDIIDVCGTGGDRSGTFNVSTASALVVAAAGVPVVKHGNRAVTSHCGSADVLEHLGIAPVLQPSGVREVLRRVGIAFLPASAFHPAVAAVMPARRILADRGKLTLFNVLGPLANPAVLHAQAVGVYSPALVRPVAEALRALGLARARVYHGAGLDEATLTGATQCAVLEHGVITLQTIELEDVGLSRCAISDLAGGDPADNAQIIRTILAGRLHGPKRDIVVLNAALALMVAGQVTDLVAARRRVEEVIDSGAGQRLLDRATGAVPVTDVLGEIISAKRAEVAALTMSTGGCGPVRDFVGALRPRSRAVIAEIKRRSPGAGALNEATDVGAIARMYECAGAAAMSVLTDGPYFGGSMNDLVVARAACAVPVLRKDFIIDMRQVDEARQGGADACLLIVAALSDAQLAQLMAAMVARGMTPVVEVHDAIELQRALTLDAEVVLINQRNLHDLSMHRERAAQLCDACPESTVVIAASGIRDAVDVSALPERINGVLVGTALMRSADPAALLGALCTCADRVVS